MVCRYSFCKGVNLVPDIISDMPIMPFNGVLISWDILAKKELLAWLALSASDFACKILASFKKRS